ncbi:DUF4350 domain-containing protein [Nocardiopsis sp. LOL_012]|uniref:DUF4350 domain-containing protein n=1 Tax=Nocardiopsis sp. LOL_012 TaxID=3345409 RepID=UPI003A8640C6
MSAPASDAARVWRAIRGPLVLVASLVTVGVLLSLGSETFPEGHLEPESPAPEGTRALVTLLREEGDVAVVRSSEAAAEAVSGAGDAVLFVSLDHRLLPEELDDLAGLGVDTVLVRPTLASLEAFAPGTDVTGRTEDGDPLSPSCGLPAATTAEDASLGGELYTAPAGSVSCYPSATGDALVRVERGEAATTVLGTGHPLTNAALGARGNAALALNLLAADQVVWLRPDPPREAGQTSLWELIPEGVRWSPLALLAALALLALWRGRRMGALVPESLPVVVRASETTEGRARLYRSRRARDRTAAALRTGFLERSVPGLGLAPDSSPEAVVAAVAARTGDRPERLRPLLYGAAPDPHAANDAALVALADALDERSEKLR